MQTVLAKLAVIKAMLSKNLPGTRSETSARRNRRKSQRSTATGISPQFVLLTLHLEVAWGEVVSLPLIITSFQVLLKSASSRGLGMDNQENKKSLAIKMTC